MHGVEPQTHRALAEIAAGQTEAVAGILELRDARLEETGLTPQTAAMVRLAALIALDGPPASYAGQIAAAIESDVSAEQLLGVLRAVGPHVGGLKLVAAAPEILLALGLSLSTECG